MATTSQKAKIDKALSQLPDMARITLALEALSENKVSMANELIQTAPKRHYSAPDLALTETIDASYQVSAHFDRAFYRLMVDYEKYQGCLFLASVFLELGHEAATPDGESIDFGEGIVTFSDLAKSAEDEITAAIIGVKRFADSIGLPVEKVLAFSNVTTYDAEMWNRYQSPDKATCKRVESRAAELCDIFAGLWKRNKRAVTRFNQDAA